ncbi:MULTISPECIES: hypothetical protein [unclassified Thermotoga]|jgi:hypothetical protein|uniref:hypothetical protein n=1 Tax=unclassified Thermotoga TaxID=2631113 RepID=UPI00054379D5|nr:MULTISPECIES: hypothetical protein [unclassified Thermotoga]KAF2959628.1 hypothetical protein AS158_04050 [Thermotoga sp. 38H-to]KHC90653.1 hypothetical protein Mc24_06978 [Thermotoga sp. Mc24]
MIRPVDFQGFVVKGVESVQNISQTLNQQTLVQQALSQHLLHQIQREQSSVKESNTAERAEVRTSTERRQRGFLKTGTHPLLKKKKTSIKEENKGLFMDVRT